MLLAFIVGLCLTLQLEAQLQVGFYMGKCRQLDAESIVREEVRKAFDNDKGVAAGLIRMHFHDCFVRGCDGSLLIDSTANNTAEKDSIANNPSLRGFEVIDNAKSILERVCPGTVSCADILAFAARDSVKMALGPFYEVPAGRMDGKVSLVAEVLTNLPPPTANVPQLTQIFGRKGLSQEEMVTLSGAHTLGRSHCTSFTNRLYNFNSTTSQDPSLDPTYAAQLKQKCPQGSTDTSLVVLMDPTTPNILDNLYYKDIQKNRGLFTSDQTLNTDPATANLVNQNADFLLGDLRWKKKFVDAMVKMGNVDVKTGAGADREIRSISCRVINIP